MWNIYETSVPEIENYDSMSIILVTYYKCISEDIGGCGISILKEDEFIFSNKEEAIMRCEYLNNNGKSWYKLKD